MHPRGAAFGVHFTLLEVSAFAGSQFQTLTVLPRNSPAAADNQEQLAEPGRVRANLRIHIQVDGVDVSCAGPGSQHVAPCAAAFELCDRFRLVFFEA